ncbi:MAG: TAT-variant-translocated molybdopterin oxidoreductase [Flavobacteriales bacterium]|nr:TAT-variant-translocated molybdopterin oxidoreductase [Flavobacteriales bacterium]
MSSSKRYWQDLAQLDRAADVIKGRENEFQAPLPIDEMLADKGLTGSTTGRRDFLKFLGFGVGAAALAACETPVIKSIPYVNKPEEIVPGVATWYASTYYDGQRLRQHPGEDARRPTDPHHGQPTVRHQPQPEVERGRRERPHQ